MPRIILEIFWDTRSPNKIFESRDKDSRTFHRMDLALQKYDNNFHKSLENSQNMQKMDNFIQKDIHNPKQKFWGVTTYIIDTCVYTQCTRARTQPHVCLKQRNLMFCNMPQPKQVDQPITLSKHSDNFNCATLIVAANRQTILWSPA